MRDAINTAAVLLGWAVIPAIAGLLFAMFGKALAEAALAPGSSPLRQYAHFWVAGVILWAAASGGLAGATDAYGW